MQIGNWIPNLHEKICRIFMKFMPINSWLVRLFKPIRGVFASLTLVFFFKETLSESINADWPF